MLHSERSSKTKPRSGQIRAKAPTTRHRTLHPARSRTKQEIVLGMLRRPEGATIAAIMKTTGWQQHSVRDFFASVVRKRLKLKLGSKKADGKRVYHLARTDGGRPSSGQAERQLT